MIIMPHNFGNVEGGIYLSACPSIHQSVRHILLAGYLIKCNAGPRSAVGNVSGYRCVSDCISRGREFDPGPVPYFRGD